MKNQEVAIAISPAQADEILKHISYIQVLQTLFTNPLRGMMIACGKRAWFRGLLALLFIGLAGACAEVLLKLPNRVEECRHVAEFLGQELGNISFPEGRLHHDRVLRKSVRGHFSHGRIDLLKQGEKITDSLLCAMDNVPLGLIISDDEVLIWQDVGDVVPYVDRRQMSLLLDKIVQLQKAGYLPEVLTPEYLREKAPALCYVMAPGLVLLNGLRYFGLMLFYAFLVSMVVSSIRRNILFFLGSSFVFALHAVIPPYVIALVYSGCFSEVLAFEPAFWLASAGYLVYAVWEARNGMKKFSGRYLIGKEE